MKGSEALAEKLIDVFDKLEGVAPGLWMELVGYTQLRAIVPLCVMPVVFAVLGWVLVITVRWKPETSDDKEARSVGCAITTAVLAITLTVFLALLPSLISTASYPQAAALKQLLGR